MAEDNTYLEEMQRRYYDGFIDGARCVQWEIVNQLKAIAAKMDEVIAVLGDRRPAKEIYEQDLNRAENEGWPTPRPAYGTLIQPREETEVIEP